MPFRLGLVRAGRLEVLATVEGLGNDCESKDNGEEGSRLTLISDPARRTPDSQYAQSTNSRHVFARTALSNAASQTQHNAALLTPAATLTAECAKPRD